jgi:hypothetical protein
MPDGTPSPRAQELLDIGEWDTKRRESLRCLGRVNCAGSISGDVKRFCGKLECTTLSHQKAGGMEPGWYITAAPKCYAAKPVLPTESNGGPITSGGAALLSQTAKPFELSKGQWRFVMEAWLADSHTVEFVDSDDHEDENEAARRKDTLWNLPDLEDQEPSNEEGDDEPALDESQSARPRLTVRTRTEVHDDADAAADLAAMMQRIMREVDQVKDREASLTSQLRLMRTEQTGLVGDLSRAHQEIANLRTHVGHLIGRVQRAEESVGAPSTGVQSSLDLLTLDMDDTKGAMQRMKLQIGELNDKFDSGGGISCHGLSFGSQTEFVRWYKRKGITNHAMFMDAIAVLHSITDAVVSDEQYNKTRESQTKNEFDNSLESTMVSSFNTMVPSGLIGGRLVKEGGAAAV